MLRLPAAEIPAGWGMSEGIKRQTLSTRPARRLAIARLSAVLAAREAGGDRIAKAFMPSRGAPGSVERTAVPAEHGQAQHFGAAAAADRPQGLVGLGIAPARRGLRLDPTLLAGPRRRRREEVLVPVHGSRPLEGALDAPNLGRDPRPAVVDDTVGPLE